MRYRGLACSSDPCPTTQKAGMEVIQGTSERKAPALHNSKSSCTSWLGSQEKGAIMHSRTIQRLPAAKLTIDLTGTGQGLPSIDIKKLDMVHQLT